jgi:hypothetical protein
LGEEIRRERGRHTFYGRLGPWEGEPHVCKVASSCEFSAHKFLTAEGEQVVSGRAVWRLTEAVIEYLLTTYEVLGAAAHTVGDTVDKTIAPPTRNCEARVGAREVGELHLDYNVLVTRARGKSEDGDSGSEVGECLLKPGVLGGAEAGLLTEVRVAVV